MNFHVESTYILRMKRTQRIFTPKYNRNETYNEISSNYGLIKRTEKFNQLKRKRRVLRVPKKTQGFQISKMVHEINWLVWF